MIAYNIDKKSKNNNGELTDYDKYTLAYVDANYNDVLYDSNIKWDAKFYTSATNSTVLYTGRYGSHYQKDFIIPIVGEEGDRYKTYCPNPVRNGALVTEDGLLPYDWNASTAYVNKSDATILYKKAEEASSVYNYDNYEHEGFSSVSAMSLSEEGILSMSGIAYISNVNFTESDDISHIVEIYDLETNEKISEFACENTDTSWYQINDGFDYKWAGFTGSYDLKDLEKGTYIFKISIRYKDEDPLLSVLKAPLDSLALFDEVIEDVDYKISTNDVYGYRIEFDKTENIFDYSTINKPSSRSSLVTIDNVIYEEKEDDTYATFTGLGMMFYLNYDDEDIEHELYFVNDEKVVKANTVTKACEFDYQTLYKSSYDMTNICYSAEVKLFDLLGEYRLYLKIKNGDYTDIVELLNMYNTIYPTIDNENYTVSFDRNIARYGIVFKVLEKEVVANENISDQ